MWSHSCWMVVLLTTVAAMPKPPDGIRVPRSAPSRLGTLDVAKYLHKYGHMSKTKMSKVGELAAFDEKNMKASIRSFQKLSGIKATGKLDEKTIQYMSLPRCGVEDTVGAITADTGGHKAHSKFVSKGKRRNGKKGRKGGKRRRGKKNRKGKKVNENRENVPRSREKRYNVQGQSWDKKVLTYQIKNYTVDMTRKQVRSAIHRAFALWAKHSQLKFKALDDNATEEADFKISFGKRYHGDYYSFDGEGCFDLGECCVNFPFFECLLISLASV